MGGQFFSFSEFKKTKGLRDFSARKIKRLEKEFLEDIKNNFSADISRRIKKTASAQGYTIFGFMGRVLSNRWVNLLG